MFIISYVKLNKNKMHTDAHALLYDCILVEGSIMCQTLMRQGLLSLSTTRACSTNGLT